MRYVAEEDRLLLRFNTKDKSLFQFWLTRRYVKVLWPAMLKVMGDHPSFAGFDQQAKKAAMGFQQQEVMQKAEVKQPFETEAVASPLGEAPLLLASVSCKQNEAGQPVLGLHDLSGKGISLDGGHQILHYIYNAVNQVMKDTGWDLNLDTLSLATAAAVPKDKLN